MQASAKWYPETIGSQRFKIQWEGYLGFCNISRVLQLFSIATLSKYFQISGATSYNTFKVIGQSW